MQNLLQQVMLRLAEDQAGLEGSGHRVVWPKIGAKIEEYGMN